VPFFTGPRRPAFSRWSTTCSPTVSTGAAAADVPALLASSLGSGEAIVWALGHCAFAVKTRTRLLIFDYITGRGPKPEQPSLANGFVNPEEIKDQNVIVFVSHAHPDHFDPVILSWRSIVKNITNVFGWRADLGEETVELPRPRAATTAARSRRTEGSTTSSPGPTSARSRSVPFSRWTPC